MLRNTSDFVRHVVNATDGPVGQVVDFYFDDDAWVIRYLVVDAGSWLCSRKVLVSPVSIADLDGLQGPVLLSITRDQLQHSPGIETDKPVSRQNEAAYMGYFGYQAYWGGRGNWGGSTRPSALAPGACGVTVEDAQRAPKIDFWLRNERAGHRDDDPHLRSCEGVAGYQVRAIDGDIGQVQGCLIDDETWAILFVVVDAGDWLPGQKVLIACDWIAGVLWAERTIAVSVSRDAVKAAPAYDPHAPCNLKVQQSLYEHYGRPGSWAGAGTAA